MKPCHLLLPLLLVFADACQAAPPVIGPDEGLLHVDWTQAEKLVGKVAFVSGKVIDVGSAGSVNFLNFDRERPPAFTGIVYQNNLANFPNSLRETYENKIVEIRGRITTYRDRPQIVATHPDQIRVLDILPETDDVPSPPQWSPRDGQITIATFNILNLFDEHDDPYHADEGTPPKPREQLQLAADTIRQLDADVIALEEVEVRGYLERFVDVFLPDMGYENVVQFEGNDLRGIDVCLLSRAPVGEVRSYRHLRFPDESGRERQFSRDLLSVTIELPGAAPLEVWVVHLKSNSGGREFAEPIRLAETQQIRRLLDKRLASDPQASIVLLGDFNDLQESGSLNTLLGSGPAALASLAEAAHAENEITYNKEPYRSMIDFMLCSPAMRERYVAESFSIVPGSTETSGSDHNPVVAKFRLE